MTFKAHSIDNESTEAQRQIQERAYHDIVEALELDKRIDTLATELADCITDEPDPAKRLEQARKWIAEDVCDNISNRYYELIFIE